MGLDPLRSVLPEANHLLTTGGHSYAQVQRAIHPYYITPDAIQSHGYDEVELIDEALNAYWRTAENVLETHICKDCVLAVVHGKLLEVIKQINTFVEQ
jgi:hypothetical protein